MPGFDFLIKKGDLHETRFADAEPLAPRDGEAVLEVESFGLTANNITYAVMGEAMSYWNHFPVQQDGWGRMPVWGFARVGESKHPDLEQGTRVYGYLPPSTQLLSQPDRVNERGFIDAVAHRAALPSAYQAYRSIEDPMYRADREDEQIIFWPLFYTSWLIDDQIADEKVHGGDTVALSSASSKTALIAAFLLAQRDGIELIGLTSPKNKEWVEGLNIYGEVLSYDELGSLPAEGVLYADFSGNQDLRAKIHEQCGEGLVYDMAIGLTHHEALTPPDGELAGPAPKFFFAPDRIRKRGEEWGTAELEKRVGEAWHPFADWASGWLEVKRGEGREDLEKTYLEVLDAKVGPEAGPIITLNS